MLRRGCVKAAFENFVKGINEDKIERFVILDMTIAYNSSEEIEGSLRIEHSKFSFSGTNTFFSLSFYLRGDLKERKDCLIFLSPLNQNASISSKYLKRILGFMENLERNFYKEYQKLASSDSSL